MNQEQYEKEVEKIITNAQPQNQLKLRALQAKCSGIRNKKHWTATQKAAALSNLMMDSFKELNDALKQLNLIRRAAKDD